MSFTPTETQLLEWRKIYNNHIGNKNLGDQIFNLMHRALLIKEEETVGFVRDKLVIFDEDQNMYYCADLKEKDKVYILTKKLVRRMVHVTSAENRLEDYYFRCARGQGRSFQLSLERALRALLQPYITSRSRSWKITFTSTGEERNTVEFICRPEDFNPRAIREKLVESNFLIHLLFHQPVEINIITSEFQTELIDNAIAAHIARLSVEPVH